MDQGQVPSPVSDENADFDDDTLQGKQTNSK